MPEAPVGGSQWMRNAGLLQDPKSQSAGLVGETLGLLAGPLAAAKAPQIAAGLLQGGENLAAARTLNPQTGAIVWHGSPHKFDKFDSSKIGTGEGVQAYGHGLYLAESPDVAKQYTTDKRGMSAQAMADRMLKNIGDKDKAIAAMKLRVANAERDFVPEAVQPYRDALEMLESGNHTGGGLYKVDLPDEHIAKMLDWDKPLSQQPKAVQTAYKKYLKSPQASEHAKSWTRYSDGMRLDQAEPLLKNPSGENLYKNAFQSREAANQWALENGIPGIRYLDVSNHGTGTGTSNFVVFPGNENLLQILERNGQTLK